MEIKFAVPYHYTLYIWPLLSAIGLAAGLNPVKPFDLIDLAANYVPLIYFGALFQYGLFDVGPVARNRAIEQMHDGILVLDTKIRIVDLNGAAQKMIGLTRSKVIGCEAAQVLVAYPDLLKFALTPVSLPSLMGEGEDGDEGDFHRSPMTNPSEQKMSKEQERKMKGTKGILLVCAVLFVSLGLGSAAAWAGGIASYELGTPDVGLAAAGWAARAQDASTLFKNPAGMSLLDKSEFQAGAQAVYGHLKFSPDSGTTTTGNDGGNAVGWAPGGILFYVQKINKDLSLGRGVLSYLGASLKYDDNWVGRFYGQQFTLIGYTLMPAVSYRIADWLSAGAGLNATYATCKQTSAIRNLATGVDGQLKVEDDTWGFGANVRVIVQPFKGTRIGIDYLSEMKLKFKDTPPFSGIGPGLTAILQRINAFNTQLNLGMFIPQMVMGTFYQELGSK